MTGPSDGWRILYHDDGTSEIVYIVEMPRKRYARRIYRADGYDTVHMGKFESRVRPRLQKIVAPVAWKAKARETEGPDEIVGVVDYANSDISPRPKLAEVEA